MKKILLPVLILTALLLRLYHPFSSFFWNVDEDIIGLNVKNIVINHHPQLIGFPIPGGIYLGPLFYYWVSILWALSLLNPLGLPIFSAILGTITVFLVYKTGKTIFEDERVGLIAAAIYAFSYLANVYARLLDGLSIAPILALLTYLFLYENLKTKRPRHLILLGLILLVSSQNEGSSISLLGLTFVVWLIYRFKVPVKKLQLIISVFIVAHLPLLLFDLRHNFFLFKSFIKFLTIHRGIATHFDFVTAGSALMIFPKTLSRFLFISGPKNIADQILPCNDLIASRISSIPIYILGFAIFVLLFFLVLGFAKKENNYGAKIIILHFFIMYGGIFIYNFFLTGYFFEWILVIFFPAFALITAYFLTYAFANKKLRMIATLAFVATFIFFNTKALLETKDNFGLNAKIGATRLAASALGDRPFYLESIGSCYAQGYNYLFWRFGKTPTYSFSDGMFAGSLYPEPTGPKPKIGVVMVNPSKNESSDFWEKYNLYKSKTIDSKKVGQIEVLIVGDK